MKKIICLIICLMLMGCSANNTSSSRPEVIEWQGYSDLISAAIQEKDPYVRTSILHEAEDMLMDIGAAIPLYSGITKYLLNTDIEGVYVDYLSDFHYSHIYRKNGDPKTPLRINIISEATNLDPQKELLSNVYILWFGTGASLLKFDENGNIVGDLATHYEVSEDGLTYKFYLRDNLKWSDGEPLTAEDFVYSYKRAAAPENGMEASQFLNIIKGYPDNLQVYSEDDKKTFVIELNTPSVYLPTLVGIPPLMPLRQDIIENTPGYKNEEGKVVNPSAWAADAPLVSCGAYTLESWKHNENMILKKNPYYYDADNVKTETIELMLNKDESISYNAYAIGDICLLADKIPSDILETLYGRPDFHTLVVGGTMYINVNVTSSMFNNMSVEDAKTFRKALGYCFDRRFLTQIISLPEESIATAIVPKNVQDGTDKVYGETEGYDYPYETGYYPIEQDYDKAREMLKSIGYEFGDDGKLTTAINIDYLTTTGATNEAVATCIQADLAQIGINVNVKALDSNIYYADRRKGDYDIAMGKWYLDFCDPLSMLLIFEKDSPNNTSQLGR